jgi:hypothetical protein
MKLASSLTKLLAVALVSTGCKNLDKFDTAQGQAYCGELVSEKYGSEGFEYWTKQNEPLKLAFTLDTSHLEDVPGKLRSNDAGFGPCTPLPLFDDAPLRVIQTARGDRLANIRLGDDHEEEVLVYVDSTCSGSMFAILSLVQDGSTELRLLRPAPDIRGPVADLPRFGVFTLNKRETTHQSGCDF